MLRDARIQVLLLLGAGVIFLTLGLLERPRNHAYLMVGVTFMVFGIAALVHRRSGPPRT